MRLENAVDEYLQWRAAQGYARNTVRNDRSHLGLMQSVIGDMVLDDIEHHHMVRVFAKVRETRAASSSNAIHGSLAAFFRWCRMRKYTTPDHDCLLGIRYMSVPVKERARVPLGEFRTLLDSATEPRERALVALGLFLFLRASEAVTLRLRDVRLDEGTIAVTVHKTGDFDLMVIPRELDVELRAWLRTYQDECGPLQPDWYLVPAKVQAGFGTHRLNPQRAISRPQEVVNRTLKAYGIDVPGESFHCLRRSGARALFNELSGSGLDGALEIVQAMLHHKSVTMTERYLGITHSRARRDTLIREQGLFPSITAANVAALRKVV